MLAHETQTRALGQVTLQQRPGIDIPERARAGWAEGIDEARQFSQRFFEDIMVIRVPGVARDDSGRARLLSPGGAGLIPRGLGDRNVALPRIAHGERDERSRVCEHLLRIDAFVRVALQVSHLALPAGREPALEFRRVIRRRRRGDPAVVETQFAGVLVKQ